ncbi:MAG: ABC transporter ATP-binding protein [Planctomycetales bacterium]|nr:ABC transporter ATP-binding protein [Planctomycetales bacterium]
MSGFVEIFNLGKTYDTPNGPLVIVENFTLNLSQGEYVSLLGHSGCGKSTVLTMVAGLNPITTGGVILANREIDGPGPDRGVVFQSPCLMPWLSALDNVLLGVDQVYRHGTRKQRRDIAAYYLELVGLGNSLYRRATELSQGMQQRVGIARALALKPRMLLLDEPFGMLDSLTRMELQEILLGILERDRITTMMITHDVDEALFMSDRVVMMTNGPRASVGAIFEMPFVRPRIRTEVLEHPEYYFYREKMLAFLEEQEQKKHLANVRKFEKLKSDQCPSTISEAPLPVSVNV